MRPGEATTSFRSSASGRTCRSEHRDAEVLKAGKHLGHHGRVLEVLRREQTEGRCGERTIQKPLIRDLALQQPCAVHLHVSLESLIRGPALRLLSMTGWTAGDWADLEEGELEGGVFFLREGRRGPGSEPGGGGDMVVLSRWLRDRLGRQHLRWVCVSCLCLLPVQDVKPPRCEGPTSVGRKERHHVSADGEMVVTENRVVAVSTVVGLGISNPLGDRHGVGVYVCVIQTLVWRLNSRAHSTHAPPCSRYHVK